MFCTLKFCMSYAWNMKHQVLHQWFRAKRAAASSTKPTQAPSPMPFPPNLLKVGGKVNCYHIHIFCIMFDTLTQWLVFKLIIIFRITLMYRLEAPFTESIKYLLSDMNIDTFLLKLISTLYTIRYFKMSFVFVCLDSGRARVIRR